MAEFLPPTTEQTIQYLEDEVSRMRAALVTSRERHAADARDLDQLRASIASWRVEEEDWKRREAELLAEVERLRASDRILVHAVNQRTIESRRWSSMAVERKAEIGHLREANAQLEQQRDALADALIAALLDRDHFEGWTWDDIAHEIDAKPCMPEWQVKALAALRLAGRLPE